MENVKDKSQKLRRDILIELIKSDKECHGNVAKFAAKHKMKQSHLNMYVTDSPESKRGIGPKAARTIEKLLSLPVHYLETDKKLAIKTNDPQITLIDVIHKIHPNKSNELLEIISFAIKHRSDESLLKVLLEKIYCIIE